MKHDRLFAAARVTALSLAAAGSLCLDAGDARGGDRYLAVFADGTRITGERLSEWHQPRAQPQLDSTRLFVGSNKLCWMRDMSVRSDAGNARPLVEFYGGDRLAGEVIEHRPGASLHRLGDHPAAHLVVRPAASLHRPDDPPLEQVKVLLSFVRRVVFSGPPRRDWQPQTLFLRDGSELRYRSLRWLPGGFRVLTEGGSQTLPFGDIAEVHLAQRDPWEMHFRQLALLAPKLEQRLLRVETADGLIVTTSEGRFLQDHYHGEHDPDRWYHLLQPAWSLDGLWLRFARIHTWKFFNPDEYLLSHLQPSAVKQQAWLGKGWHWQADRNVTGRPLRSGGWLHGWGLGVHAFSELTFHLPPLAKSFRTRIGLDQSVGDGGCVRARVILEGKQRKVLFESGHLVGSHRGADSGTLPLPASDEPRRLTLQADPAHADRPAGADPLDVRDMLNWLEPIITFDPVALQQEVAQRRAFWLHAWRGWEIVSGGDDLVLESVWDPNSQPHQGYRVAVGAQRSAVVLARRIRLPQQTRWLLVAAHRLDEEPAGRIEVRLDGELADVLEIPRLGQRGQLMPLAVAVSPPSAEQVSLELRYHPAGTGSAVIWEGITLAEQLPTVAALLEDDLAAFAPAPREKSAIRSDPVSPFSGKRCLRLVSTGGEARVRLADLELPIREHPALGEYRYLRLATRVSGDVLGMIELHAQDRDEPRSYDFGMRPAVRADAKRILGSAPPEWIVITRDLYQDFGSMNLAGLGLTAHGQGSIWFDHVYLARHPDDFRFVGGQSEVAPDRGREASLQPFAAAIAQARQALVVIEVDGLRGSGVIVQEDGLIVTTGYVAIAPDKPARITLADGRTVAGRVLGVDRDLDLAQIRIQASPPAEEKKAGSGDTGKDAKASWPFILWTEEKPADDHRHWVALTHLDHGQPAALGAALVRHHGGDDDSVWVALEFRRAYSGGILIDRQGRLQGILSRPYGPGGTLAVPGRTAYLKRIELANARPRGQWPWSVTPHLGLNAATRRGQLTVIAVRKEGPAAAAGIRTGDRIIRFADQQVDSLQQLLQALGRQMPGEEVTLEILRGETTIKPKIKLGRRGPRG